MILRKTRSPIVDDLKPEQKSEREQALESENDGDDGDICTLEAEPPTDEDNPLE